MKNGTIVELKPIIIKGVHNQNKLQLQVWFNSSLLFTTLCRKVINTSHFERIPQEDHESSYTRLLVSSYKSF